jgi:hypothetical protein
MVRLNRGLVSNPAAPFGGVKHSGFGREGGREGIDDYTATRYVAIATGAASAGQEFHWSQGCLHGSLGGEHCGRNSDYEAIRAAQANAARAVQGIGGYNSMPSRT